MKNRRPQMNLEMSSRPIAVRERKRTWAVVLTRTMCGLKTSLTPLNFVARVYRFPYNSFKREEHKKFQK